jgi:hypothetical protein
MDWFPDNRSADEQKHEARLIYAEATLLIMAVLVVTFHALLH